MKKKLIIATVLSVAFVGATTWTISANNDGYELYKTALKKTHVLHSAEAFMETKVTVNNEIKQTIDLQAQYNFDQMAASSSVAVGMGEAKEQLGFTMQNGEFYIQNEESGDVFKVKTEREEAEEKDYSKHHDPELMKIGEKIFDTLTLQLHDDFKVKGDKITVDLDNRDIPTLFRQIGQYMVKKGTSVHENATMSTSEYPFLTEDLTADLPVLTQNIKIEQVKLEADLEGDMLVGQTMFIKVTGEDEKGNPHEILFEMNMKINNTNGATISEVPFDEGMVQTIELKGPHH